jgi:HSP20 family protein
MLPVLRNNWVPAVFPLATGPSHRFDSFFDRFFGDDGGFAGATWSSAPLAMWEDDDRIWVEAELPGVKEADVEVTVHNGMLTIRGQRQPEEGRRYFYNGRTYGRFERVITLPAPVEAEGVEATLTDGVLRVGLPKSPEAKPRRIALKAGD